MSRGVLALVGDDGAFCKGGPSRTKQNGYGPSTGAAEQLWLTIYPERQSLARAALSDDAPLSALSASTTASSSNVNGPSLVCTDWARINYRSAVDLVAFALITRDLIKQIAPPAASFSQTLQEPWLTMDAIDNWRGKIASLELVVRTWREMLRVTFLLRQWLYSHEVEPFVRACFYASADDFFLCEDRTERAARVWGRGMPAFMQTFFAMASNETPHFNGLELQRTQPVSEFSCLGPHCQCHFPADTPRPAKELPRWVKHSRRGAVRPHSTAYAPAPLRFQY